MDEGLSAVYEREENKKLLFSYAMAKRDIKISKIYLDKTQDASLQYYEKNASIMTLYIMKIKYVTTINISLIASTPQ